MIAPELAAEIDAYEIQMELRKQGKLDEKIFAESRLRRGVYGQRYDNGHRHDGMRTRQLEYPERGLTKGPETLWDAPGMQRIKIPFGGLSPEQMDVLADLAEEYSDGILHVTTRQDFQLHFVHIEDTPSLMRRLAAVGITTREACGNSVRNVTACPISGVCRDEAFDVTPYAKACSRFLLGHRDTQDFGRKFKPAFSGCKEHACGLVSMHDIGFIAARRIVDGKEKRGFEFYVGGGLGAVPHQAKLIDPFLPEEELLPMSQAVSRVFARLGEKKNRQRARIKFLVASLGIDEFRRLVQEERRTMPEDPRWTAYLKDVPRYAEKPIRQAVPLNGLKRPEGFESWYRTNVYQQKQGGYVVATVTLPLGDLTSQQLRKLAGLAREYSGDNIRTTVEQNILLRWVSEADLPALYQELRKLGLAQPGGGTIVDVTACPGTDTCKLGIASSRGLASELRNRLMANNLQLDEAVRGLRIKISGCFNSCGQHHIADIGFYGNSRTIGSYKVPHFQVVLGGKWTDNAGAYGLAIASIPSKRIPDAVVKITDFYVQQRQKGESFQNFIQRVGKKAMKDLLDELTKVPAHNVDASYYSDWGDSREFTLGDMGTGECAGEVVPRVQFELSAAEREAFEAQLHMDSGDYRMADETAYAAMIQAAKALVFTEFLDVANDPATIVTEFRKRFYDTQLFHNKFVGGKFAQYLFRRHESPTSVYSKEGAHQLVEEAQLFIEAAYACYGRIAAEKVSAAALPGPLAGLPKMV
ncbi:MAG: nitrite/sulfite reductase [Planctomycetes bacterium]|nr:nitrite/sulfite reductase [Planctomycetota bacterium]